MSMDDEMLLGPVFCRNCRRPLTSTQRICPYCGRDQQQKDVPPPVQAVPVYAPPPPPAPWPPPDAELIELATQYKDAKSHAVLTFIMGLFCIWPAWIWTYIANTKMEAIRVRVAAKGINPQAWVQQIYYRGPH